MSETKIKNIPVSKLEINKGQVEGLPKNPRFIRDIRKGTFRKGRKIRGETALYWDRDYIDKMAAETGLN